MLRWWVFTAAAKITTVRLPLCATYESPFCDARTATEASDCHDSLWTADPYLLGSLEVRIEGVWPAGAAPCGKSATLDRTPYHGHGQHQFECRFVWLVNA